GGIPVLVIPFYIFPLNHERHSGFMIPRVGSNSAQGVFVKNLAYYQVDKDLIRLEGKAQVSYGEVTIDADSIDFFTRDQLMVVRTNPVLHDKDDAISGDRMVYDFKARRGWIYNGSTKFLNGRYWGSRIRQVGERTLNVDYGRFTTCDDDTPHFYFWSRRMKIYLGDKMVAEPVALCFAGVPVLVLPYYFFPLNHDRHSGFMMPRPGSNSAQGVFVKNLAYYQVINDQADITVAADYFEYVGWQGNFEGRWWRQPSFTFNTHFSYLEQQDPFQRRWTFSFDHYQTLGKNTTLTGTGNFISDKSYYTTYAESRDTRMDQQLHSYLALDHRWTTAVANVVLDHTQNLLTKETNTTLPEASFQLYTKDLFGNRLHVSGRSYAASFQHRDTTATQQHQVWDNQAQLSSGLTLARYVSVTPSAMLVATWYDRDTAGRRNPVRYFYSGGVSAGTTLYGLLPVGIGPLVAFRHQLQPAIGYSYAPKIDQGRFYQVGQAGSYGQQQSVSASLSNTFSLKYRWGTATRKTDLLTYRASSGLDLLQHPRRWAALSSGLSLLPGNRYVDCQLSSSYDWYRRITQYTSLNVGFRLDGKWLGQYYPDSAAAAAGSAAAKPQARDSSAAAARPQVPDSAGADSSAQRPDSLQPRSAAKDSAAIKRRQKAAGLPWSFWLSFSQNWQAGQHITESGIRGNFDIALTKNWKLTYGQYYDFKRREIVSRDYSIYRDLHCWEASFTSTSSGVYWSYEFRINLKKIPELKLSIPKTGQVQYQ
ncbi:MAG TPA: LPS assembly protein LptD, partial [Candidatus Edwardsbacteria bacterium]|nr:LPS assembly protein LptD [Candidatus Edwardsbacteria bacterium]